jgi:hypothetical protein
MTQTRLGSFIEAMANIVIGYVINFFGNLLILPLFGFHVTIAQNIQIGLLFTGVSIARQYVLRRWFNARLHRLSQKLAGAPVDIDLPPVPVPPGPTECTVCSKVGYYSCHCPTVGSFSLTGEEFTAEMLARRRKP